MPESNLNFSIIIKLNNAVNIDFKSVNIF